jgi:hypothetical protein
MNHYQSGFLAGLNNQAANTNPLLVMASQFNEGREAKDNNVKFTETNWVDKPLTFREGYKSKGFAHLENKGRMLDRGFESWSLGHTSGLNKFHNVLDKNVHSVSFTVSVEVTALNKDVYDPFTQKYTYLDHTNEVYRIEARQRFGLTSVYPDQHIINEVPCLPGTVTALEIQEEVGCEILIDTHDILQSASKGYQPLTVKGINFVQKSFSSYVKMLLDIPQWNREAADSVNWAVGMPSFK